MNQRQLLTLAIIAFDLMIKDAIKDDMRGEKLHPVASKVFEHLVHMLNRQPELNHASEQYLINVAEISADIKRIFLATPIDEDSLAEMLQLQKERLKWLGSRPDEQEDTCLDADRGHLH